MTHNAPTPAFGPPAPRQAADHPNTDPQPWQDIALEMLRSRPDVPDLWSRYPNVRDSSEREPLREGLRNLILRRDRYRCRFCGEEGGQLEVDHIIPWSAGGSDKASNLRTLCAVCNQQRSNFRYMGDGEPSLPISSSCDRCWPTWEPPGTPTRQVRMWCSMCGRVSLTSDSESLS